MCDGATWRLALGDDWVDITTDTAGRTISIDRVRTAPDRDGRPFQGSRNRHEVAIAALRNLSRLLRRAGTCLARLRPVVRPGPLEGYVFSLSGEAYSILQRSSVLESEHSRPTSRLTRG